MPTEVANISKNEEDLGLPELSLRFLKGEPLAIVEAAQKMLNSHKFPEGDPGGLDLTNFMDETLQDRVAIIYAAMADYVPGSNTMLSLRSDDQLKSRGDGITDLRAYQIKAFLSRVNEIGS